MTLLPKSYLQMSRSNKCQPYLTTRKLNIELKVVKVCVNLTTATAFEFRISALLKTIKYDIFAKAYTTVTRGREIQIARGKLLKNKVGNNYYCSNKESCIIFTLI